MTIHVICMYVDIYTWIYMYGWVGGWMDIDKHVCVFACIDGY